ncbi:hypothetical protein [Calidifontibacter terrae]
MRAMQRLRSPQVLAVVAIVGTIILANAIYLFGIRSNDPLLYDSGLGSPARGVTNLAFQYGHAPHTIDANEGWTAQALGRAAAQMWAHGNVPLWNPYEGLGQPLAGEMQSAAFFLPFALLQLLPNGIFAMHLALELVAGIGTLLFLRSLRLSWAAAAAGGCLFAVNGAFSVMTNAPFNPIAFLPVALWGVELVARSTRSRAGLWVIALAIAAMLFAGFPETAYLEALFVGVWSLVRLGMLRRTARLRFVLQVAAGGVAGVLIAAPVLVAFLHFLNFGVVSYHNTAVNNLSYDVRFSYTLGLKYITGALYLSPIGSGQAGYVTLSALLVAFVGALCGRRHRALRITAVVVFFVFVLNMYGFGPIKVLLNLIPGMSGILGYKYALVLIEFSVAVLAAYGIDDLRRADVRGRRVALAALAAAAYVISGLIYLHGKGDLKHVHWTIVFVAWSVLICALLVAAMLLVRAKPARAGLVAVFAVGLLAVDAGATYAVPQLSASPQRPVDLAPVHYLQTHLGTSRFYSLGPIQPNYGSYFGIAQINANDLPVPRRYSSYLLSRLKPHQVRPGGNGVGRAFISYELAPLNFPVATQKRLLAAYGQQQRYFREASVQYLVMSPGVAQPTDGARYGLVRVFADHKAEIWRDARATPYYTTAGNACRVEQQSYTAVTLNCTKATVLQRTSLSTPGWSATINNRTVKIPSGTDYFQSLVVPAGHSRISFDYRPRMFAEAVAVSVGVLLLMVADCCWLLVRRRRGNQGSLLGFRS